MIVIANAVAKLDNLEFLGDIVPKTTTWREHIDKKAKESGQVVERKSRPLPAGQTTLDRARPRTSHVDEQMHAEDEIAYDNNISSPNEYMSHTVTAPSANGASNSHGNGTLVFEHYAPNGVSRHDGSDDVEMT